MSGATKNDTIVPNAWDMDASEFAISYSFGSNQVATNLVAKRPITDHPVEIITLPNSATG